MYKFVYSPAGVGAHAARHILCNHKARNQFLPPPPRPPCTFRAAQSRAACRSLAAARGGAGGDGERIGWQGPNTNKRELQPSDSGRQPVVDPGQQRLLETPPLRVSTASRTDSQHRPCRQHTCTRHFVFACTGWWGRGGGGVCIREVCL